MSILRSKHCILEYCKFLFISYLVNKKKQFGGIYLYPSGHKLMTEVDDKMKMKKNLPPGCSAKYLDRYIKCVFFSLFLNIDHLDYIF